MSAELDDLVHQATRLRIFAYLYRHGETTFPELRAALDLTEGNLASHLRTLEDANAVSMRKEFVDRRPQTTYSLTPGGAQRYEAHLRALTEYVDDVH